MKLALILTATGCIVWLLNTLLRLHGPVEIDVYLTLLALVGIVAYFVVPRVAQTERGYAICYGICMAPICATAIYAAAHWAVDLGLEKGSCAVAIGLVFGVFLAWIVGEELPLPHTLAVREMLIVGFVFTSVGFVSVASAIPDCSSLQFRLRIVLGSFWVASGAYAFADVLGNVRARALWYLISSYATQVMCIAFLGGLAFFLSGLQREVSYQGTPETIHAEQTLATEVE